VNKTAASAAQLAKCTLFHAYLRTTASSQVRENKQMLNSWFNSWHSSIFGYKLRTDLEQLKLKILKKLRTASLNSEFTGSYIKKSVAFKIFCHLSKLNA